ncbi:MAG: hypothetical protein KDD73_01075 [Anaerolineales bacterium]|nr:hypothetical protein [Anaerolineales bacterium]
MSQLDHLAQQREGILLAEAIGWLHDYRKCSEEQLLAQSANSSGSAIARTKLANRFASLNSASLTLASVTEPVLDLLNQPRGQADNLSASLLQQYLARCHNTAHFDKQDPLDSGKQNYPGTQISTAFGFEIAVGAKLTTQLWALPWNDLTTFSTSNRNSLLNTLQTLFITVGADTRRPINEINLWDWGKLVGALYKTAVAAVVLGHQPANRDLRWQLLAVRTDALAYLTNVSRLPDLIARQTTLQTAINKVQTLLEETYPLATEVYRDENGSLYIVSNLPNLLTLQSNGEQTLQAHIQQQFTTDGEIVPQITLDPTAWWGQDPDRQGNDEIPPAGTILSSATTLQNDASVISEAWQNIRQTICPICGLRPCVNRQLDYCQVCGERRKGRVVEWLQDQSKTIWLDEVADHNGRLALITGTFDLTNWLDGSLVETLLVKEPGNGHSAVAKTPSFARLRRIWQTTQTFWEQAQSDTNQCLTDARRRLSIQLTNSPSLSQSQTYELDLRGHTRMSVLWNGERLISIDNLSYTAIQLGIQPQERKTSVDAALAVGVWIEANNQKGFQLISDDEKNTQYDVKIANIDYQDTAYATTIPILAQPRTFMALVPANRALGIAQAIKTKYECEMGKVRNRLPLHLGVVYFQRRTPLRTALDAGRRMLKYEGRRNKDEKWTVRTVQKGPLPEGAKRLAKGTQQFAETVTVELEQRGRSLTWYIPAKMGDGGTDDNWYPYIFIQNEVSGRQRTFKGIRPKSDGTSEECWLVHAAELKKDDQIYFTPATLDFQWLDSASQRFKIAYDENGRRRNLLTRPYLLDELEAIQQAWNLIASENGLASNQIYALRDLVESKRGNWQPTAEQCQKDGMFWQFCHDAVANANWRKDPSAVQINQLTGWAVSGLLTDVTQLYMSIMKQKLQWEGKGNE